MTDGQEIDRRIAELESSLAPRRAKFAREFITDLRKKDAALRAGYSTSGAGVEATKLLAMPEVCELIELLKMKRDARTDITADRVVRELAAMAFGNTAEIIETKDKNGNTVGKIQRVTEKGKLKALELLGKHTAAFTENLNLTTNGKDLPPAQQVVNVLINHRKPGQELDPMLE